MGRFGEEVGFDTVAVEDERPTASRWPSGRICERCRAHMREAKDTASLISLCVQGFEEADHLSEVLRTQDRERSVTDEQVRAYGCHPVDVARDCVDGHPVVEGDPCGDQSATFEASLDHEEYI
jgi:hypothetical protein